MHRTQIMLTDAQYEALQEESRRTGRSLAELVRRSLDAHYNAVSASDRERLLKLAFAGWSDRSEVGADYVERLRSGTSRRLRPVR